MKVISFNIRCTNDDPDGHSISERAPRLFKILKEESADVIGLQEVTPVWLELIKNELSAEYEIFNKFRSLEGWREAEPILWKKSRFEMLDSGYFWFSDTPWVESLGSDYLYHCNRICEWVLLFDKKTDKKHYHFNLHFGFGDDYQVESVELIKKTFDLMPIKNAVITGDFNMKPDTPAYKKMTEYFTDANSLTAKYSGTTYHGYGKENNEHIDYCFITVGTVSATDYRVLDKTFDGKFPSDHFGLQLELEVK